IIRIFPGPEPTARTEAGDPAWRLETHGTIPTSAGPRIAVHHPRRGPPAARGAGSAVASGAAQGDPGGRRGGGARRPLGECRIHLWEAPPARDRPPRAVPADEARRHGDS